MNNLAQRRCFARHVQRVLRQRQGEQFAAFQPAPPPPSGDGWFGRIDRCWTNGWYAVLGRPVQTQWGEVLHLAVIDIRGSRLTWSEKQWIKDQIVGPERLAIEVYPAREKLVDAANMYHLWVMPVGFTLPFGIKDEEHAPCSTSTNS
ncbi:MAG: hypothetical protein HRF48_14365 [Chloroflexota bacterium]